MKFALPEPHRSPEYQNWDFNAAGAAFEWLTGKNIYDALEGDLARPLGMQDFDRRRQTKVDNLPESRFPEYDAILQMLIASFSA